ncbi:MAG: DUF1499 domain-containing protein [Pseudomonadota bacterium]
MSETIETPKAGWRMKVAAFALCVSIFAVLWFAVAALGTKWGFWSWKVGLGQMTMGIGLPIAGFSLLLSLIAQGVALLKFPRKQAFIVALVATVISGLVAGRIWFGFIGQATSLPPIHDIQTDWSDPVQFSPAIMQAREAQGETNPVLDSPVIPEAAKGNWPGMEGRLVSEVQEEAETKGEEGETVYPPMQALYFNAAPADLADLVLQIVDRRGWALITQPGTASDLGAELQVEATVTSGWFGFKDDVAIRIRPVEGATRVDMRSTSRVGLSDLGANSKRVYGFMTELADRGDGRLEP